jgi:hypothetical protein
MSGIIIEIYDEFPHDFLHVLNKKARSETKALIGKLSANPYDPTLQKASILHEGERFEYALDGGLSIFWRVQDRAPSITEQNLTVWLEKIGASTVPTKPKSK